jgi:NAD(P)-dependent dehydrogenase (short-subunit alcohol dehydrogenase family)
VEKTVSQVVQDFGQIDVLVTCAGTCIARPTAQTDLALWRKVLDVNLDGTYLFARNVGKHLLERGAGGSMVFIASVAGTQVPTPQKQASYNASKAALKLLAASLGKEWASNGIRVNCLSPGYMDTKLLADTATTVPVSDTKDQWLKQIPMGWLHSQPLRSDTGPY